MATNRLAKFTKALNAAPLTLDGLQGLRDLNDAIITWRMKAKKVTDSEWTESLALLQSIQDRRDAIAAIPVPRVQAAPRDGFADELKIMRARQGMTW